MNYQTPKALLAAIAIIAAAVLSSCTSTQQQQQRRPQPPPTPEKPAPKPQPAREAYGPSSSTFEQNGVRYIKGTMAFPTGLRNSSGLLLEKVVPAEVMAGQNFQYTYQVINLTDYKITDVIVRDQVSANFKAGQADPNPASVKDGLAEWIFGELGPKQTATIKVYGAIPQEGTVTTCGWASYNPVLCESIKSLRAALKLAKSAPAEVVMCDTIPMKLTVSNTGSSVLTGVKITDTLPEGLTTDNGQRSQTFDVGTLAPNQSRDLSFNAKAAKTGKFVNTAKATTAQGVEAEASSTTTVRQPVLKIACETPEERFAGRPARVSLTVVNEGDAASAGTVIELPLPAGTSAPGVSDAGRLVNNRLLWDLGTLAPKATKTVHAEIVRQDPGSIALAATARGACAGPVTTSCSTRVMGIPAILLEVIDLEDPIEVGSNEVYEITVTNQGSAPGTNIKITCTLEDSQEFVAAAGAKVARREGGVIELAPIASLAPGTKVSIRVTVKAAKAANVRFKASMTSDQLSRPVEETESTNQY